MPQAKPAFAGIALFSYGFRTFFLLAILFAAGVIPVWVMIWRGDWSLAGPFQPVDWHIHEMIFGYAFAVITGFLFTAIPNWTGRMPKQGWPLVALAVLWIAGRAAVAGFFGLAPVVVMLVDLAFGAAVLAMIAIEIVAGRNWRNLMVVVPVGGLWLANLAFHLEAMTTGSVDYGRRAALSLVLFLILLIGGRVIPSFTRNWLVKQKVTALPIPFNRFDAASLIVAALALAAWIGAPESRLTGVALTLAALIHLVRLLRWQGARTWASPLLVMLHIAYLQVPLGFAALAISILGGGVIGQVVGLHLLGIGAIAGMTVAVMMRATMGHSGRPLEAGAILTLGFATVVLSGFIRAGTAAFAGNGVLIAATLWTLGFAMVIYRLAPMLWGPSLERKKPS
ncbi:NnrS family protein [Pseudorhodobacter sp.]|uniref:NnrS family protein n=1 Tax=Pseudorhodobacter sp. TaxID=1934400 RepID=UPI002649F0E0|nr:NnrS family protein [Pseudorhodobacter sp.]MDN5788284.1 NnrS family protein [Pseudorhodobacter sp.]